MTEKQSIWTDAAPAATLGQLAHILQSRFPGLRLQDTQQLGSRRSQLSAPDAATGGVLAIQGEVQDDGGQTLVSLRLKLAQVAENQRVNLRNVLGRISKLNQSCRLDIEPVGDSQFAVWVQLLLSAQPLGVTREAALLEELQRVTALAEEIQRELPLNNEPDLAEIYKATSGLLEPVFPWKAPEEMIVWAAESADFLMIGSSLALEGSSLDTGCALATLASEAGTKQLTIGHLRLPAINVRAVLELADKAPGIVVIPASRLSLGSNVYELGNESSSLLSVLEASGRSVIFSGSLAELQAAFGGGQGGQSDPLQPILRHVPPIRFSELVRFVVGAAGRIAGGIPPGVESRIVEEVQLSLTDCELAERKRLLPLVARRLVRAWSEGRRADAPSVANCVRGLRAARETLGGISRRPRVRRDPEVQERFVRVLTGPQLMDRLKEHLVGQDRALNDLVARLRSEALSRPLHQPLRFCCEGPPASGKSSSVALLADFLDVPLVNIDAASMSDSYTASAQLLGSGRGIVGSHQAGRLEQVAGHHRGAVVEISDIDHAVPAVRSSLADLFLQVLETGEAQSATGAMFGCQNILFAFTMNLPGGRDQDLRKHLGFVSQPSREDIQADIASEIQHLLSAAFLSRVGSPILFEPLDDRALSAILERAICSALETAAERLNIRLVGVRCDQRVGARILSARELDAISSGARGLLELGRTLATEALLALLRHKSELTGCVLRVAADKERRLTLIPMKEQP